MSAHLEQDFGQSVNAIGDGSILPVNTALAFPTLGGTMTDLSLSITQKFGDSVSISLGKFNMLDVAAAPRSWRWRRDDILEHRPRSAGQRHDAAIHPWRYRDVHDSAGEIHADHL